MNASRNARAVRSENSFARYAQQSLYLLLAVASAIFLGLLMSAPAMAQSPDWCAPTGNETLETASYRYQPGQTLHVTGSGYQASCNLSVRVSGPDSQGSLSPVTTDASGNLDFSYPLGSVTGDYTVATVFGQDGEPWSAAEFTSGAYIETDMLDYAPGNRVTISGAGWQPGETVSITVAEMDNPAAGPPFTYVPIESLTADADSAGVFTNGDFLTDLLDLGVAFRAGATGQSSGHSAETFFTDGDTGTSRATGNYSADSTWSTTRAGKITTLTTSKIVTGDGSGGQNFTVDLQPGIVITTTGDVVIGTVDTVDSATQVTLLANAASVQTLATYKARIVPGTWTLPRPGNITTSTASTLVTGDGTGGQNFRFNLAPGFVLTDSTNAVIGTVATVTDATHATLAANAALTQTAQPYKASKVTGSADAAIISNGNTVTVQSGETFGINTLTHFSTPGTLAKNLTIQSGGTLNVAGLMSMDASGGTMLASVSGTLNAGSLSISGGGGLGNTSTMTLSGGSLHVTGNVTLNARSALLDVSTGTATIDGNVAVNGCCTPAIARLQVGSGQLTVGGNVTFANTGPEFLTFTGAGTAKIGGTLESDGALTFNPTGNIAASTGSPNVTGNLGPPSTLFTTQITIGSQLYTTAGALIGTVQSITDNTHLVLTANALVNVPTDPFLTSDSLSSTVEYNGTGNGSIGAYTYQNLKVSKTGGAAATLAGSTQVNRDVTVVNPTGVLAGSGSLTLTLGGNVVNSGTIHLDGGTDNVCGDTDTLLIRSTVTGTQRSWSGNSTSLTDVNVQDQAGTASITVASGTSGFSSAVTASFTNPSTITKTSGTSFLTSGFAIGQKITTSNGTNPGPYTITFVSATVITVAEATITTLAAAPVTITNTGNNGANWNILSGCVGPPAAANSTITGTGPVAANGVASSTITITLKDAGNNPVAGVTPTFSATDTGATNVYGACSMGNAFGVSTCTLKSTTAEVKTLSIQTPVIKADGSVTFTAAVADAANSTITGTGPVAANGVASSTVTITLKDADNVAVAGVTPTFSASGSNNVYGACSVGNASGVSTCSLKSTTAEVKTLSIQTPVIKADGTVTFTAAVADAANSTITGTGPVAANGVASSTVTITLKDADNVAVAGVTPTFSASGSNNVYGACSVGNASGVSTCSLKSTTAEVKTLSIQTPVIKADGTVTFTAAVAAAANSTITGTGPVAANGVATSTVTITLKDADNVAVAGVTPTFSATDTGATNVYGACSVGNASGVSTCSLKSTTAEVKTLSIQTPVIKADGTVTFTAAVADAANSTITGTGPVAANGVATSTVTITLKDSDNVAVAGVTPTFSATDTGATNVYGACSVGNASGVSTCSLKSTTAEIKTLSIQTPVIKADGTVTFTAPVAAAANSTITGTGPVAANGVASSTITITLKDADNVAVAGVTPTFSASGSNNVYGACSVGNASGVSTCSLKSTTAEVKTLSIQTPVIKADGTVTFTAPVAAAANSTITGTGPVAANGVATSTVTITLKDSDNVAVAGVTPTFSATDTGATNVYGACSATNGSGVSTCSLASTTAETKTLSITSPVSVTGGTVTFTAPVAAAANSTITGTGPVAANGVATSTVTITLKDSDNVAVAGVTPTFSASGSNNVYGACSVGNASGVSTCSLKSTTAEVKTLSIQTPVIKADGTVTFTAPVAAAANSTITGTGPVAANGVATSTVTITLKDSDNVAVAGVTPTFSASGSNNVYGACSVGNASGVSTCSLKSTTAEVKTLSIQTPVIKADGTVTFTAPVAAAANSTITGTGPVAANGVATSTVTITLKDSDNVAVAGVTPTFSASGSNNVYGACSVGNASGVSTCSLKSTTAEVKTLSIQTPVIKADGTVTFTAPVAAAANSTITGTGPVAADGVATSTVTITLKDSDNVAVAGVTPTFSATGSNNTYGACSATNGSGVSTCSLASTTAETKTLSITSPVSVTGGTVTFTAVSTGCTLTGFSQPIDMNMVNSANAGQAIPVKYNLTCGGVPVSDPATFESVTTLLGSCGTAPSDTIETYAGSSGLLYQGNGNWQFNWKTPKTYAASCRTMTLTVYPPGALHTGPGLTLSADFKFK